MSFAEKNKLPYFETSAKNNTGIEEGISFIVNNIYQKLENINNNNNIILNKNGKSLNSDYVGKKKNKTDTKIKK